MPESLREAPPDSPSLNEVRAQPAAHVGQVVRWGGTIAAVANGPDETCVEVVSRALGADGRPLSGDQSAGRFLACVEGFLDPVIYEAGRQLTVSGRITGVETRRVGEYPTRQPRIQVQAHHLWEPEPPPSRYVEPDPFWYDPFFPYPYYPYYPYRPWYRPPVWVPR